MSRTEQGLLEVVNRLPWNQEGSFKMANNAFNVSILASGSSCLLYTSDAADE